MNGYIIVLVTAKNKTEARRIARFLLDERLIACANIIDGLESWFTWEKKVQSAREVLMVMKTKAVLFKRMAARVKVLHSYQTPEIIALPIVAGDHAYLKWVNGSVLKGDV